MKKNLIASAVEKAILDNFQKDNRYHVIKKSVPSLDLQTKPKAYKEISKVLYVNEIKPPISKQGHDTKTVLGATGEALTELILPPIHELDTNNRGYDLEHDDSKIEIKSTVEDRVSLSNVQYATADYLVIHIYDKYSDDYRFSYLIPLKILQVIKGFRQGNVTINLYKETWVEFFKVTLIRLNQFFRVRRMYLDQNTNTLMELRYSNILDSAIMPSGVHIRALFTSYMRCGSWKWERRYAYYEYYRNRHPNWFYEHNCLVNEYSLGLYAVYHDNQWKRRTL